MALAVAQDAHFFIAGDRINDLTCEKVGTSRRLEAVLACQDRMVRVIAGDALLYEAPMGGPVLTVERYQNSNAGAGQSGQGGGGFSMSDEPQLQINRDGRYQELIYGTVRGRPPSGARPLAGRPSGAHPLEYALSMLLGMASHATSHIPLGMMPAGDGGGVGGATCGCRGAHAPTDGRAAPIHRWQRRREALGLRGSESL